VSAKEQIAASFRDPSGFLFRQKETLYRQVNPSYQSDYDRLMTSGLYDALVREGLLVPHAEVELASQPDGAYKILRPAPVPFISYPYEWCFSQLKDAAWATLRIQKKGMDFGMSLKDASAYNIQFLEGKPVLIDTLSFETYAEGKPWVAYRQFCQHFLGPLALMSTADARLLSLSRSHVDGIPLDLVSQLLPFKTRLSLGLSVHLHLHAKAQQQFSDKPAKSKTGMSRTALLGFLDNLESTVNRLRWNPAKTAWSHYYEETNYSADAFEKKKQQVARYLERLNAAAKTVWDLGANTGTFSRLASQRGMQTIAFDMDPACVERNYLACRQEKETHLLPLVLDLTNPSPGLGWENKERMGLAERGPADLILALALLHHLAIANNLPLAHIARFFSRLGQWLIIEFVPKTDSQTQRLLVSREDIFTQYTQAEFEKAFAVYFSTEEKTAIEGTGRWLYFMKRTP
jgi:hypothetical protein